MGMRRADRIFDLLMASLCVFYLVSSLRLDRGTMKETGPGFIPVILGIGSLVVVGLILRDSLKNIERRKTEEVSTEGKWRYLSCILACIIFIPLFEQLGPLVSVFALVLALTKVWGSRGWLKPVLLSAVSSAAVYIIFSTILEVPFPRDILLVF